MQVLRVPFYPRDLVADWNTDYFMNVISILQWFHTIFVIADICIFKCFQVIPRFQKRFQADCAETFYTSLGISHLGHRRIDILLKMRISFDFVRLQNEFKQFETIMK